MYKMQSSYVLHMEAKVLGIGEFRRQLSARVEAANFEREVTVVMHDKRNDPRAALVPYKAGDEPIPIGANGEVSAYVVSREWFERATDAMRGSKGK